MNLSSKMKRRFVSMESKCDLIQTICNFYPNNNEEDTHFVLYIFIASSSSLYKDVFSVCVRARACV